MGYEVGCKAVMAELTLATDIESIAYGTQGMHLNVTRNALARARNIRVLTTVCDRLISSTVSGKCAMMRCIRRLTI